MEALAKGKLFYILIILSPCFWYVCFSVVYFIEYDLYFLNIMEVLFFRWKVHKTRPKGVSVY